ncbi:MAG TPA: (deoxy)nucleoside triphosphate pyrophosphohydrolase [Thermoanaerobaculia bacterium]|jgi:8-oxo-dGTP diphosphatase|nr:(deoxy)nucleoside triphosphate pyrophosphohydrolase [Thermoanaerobaculia bacterium]
MIPHRSGGREVLVVGAAIVRDGRCLAAQRGPAMRLPGKWEFPGGKVEEGEDPRAALAREVREELGLEIAVGELLGTGRDGGGDAGGEVAVRLDVYLATLIGGELSLLEHADVRWLTAAELDAVDWAAADRPLLPLLRERLGGEL